MTWPYTRKAGIDTCRDCSDRHVGCHSTCKKYIEAKEQYEKERKEYKDARKKDDIANDVHYKSVARMKRIRHTMNKD